ncbi:hypothetical protein YC2023_019763 [Brassica napus]
MAKECMAGKKDGKTYNKSKDAEKYRDLRNWSCAASYGLGSRSPLNPSFNVGLELARNSQAGTALVMHLLLSLVIYKFSTTCGLTLTGLETGEKSF